MLVPDQVRDDPASKISPVSPWIPGQARNDTFFNS